MLSRSMAIREILIGIEMTIGFANLRNAFYKRRFVRSGVFKFKSFSGVPNMGENNDVLEKMARERLELQKLSVHILRAMGRDCGVRTPTTKRKAEIIEEIIAIKHMGQKPYFSPYGRKKNFDLSAMPEGEEGKVVSVQELDKAVCEAAAKLAARLPKEVVLIMKQQLKSGINELIDKIIDNYLIQAL